MVVVLVPFVFDPLLVPFVPLVPPKLIRRFAVNVPLQILTFVTFVTVTELVVTAFVSVTVAIGLVAMAFVSIPETMFVVLRLVSATEFVVEKALTGGNVIAGVPIEKMLLEVPKVVVVPGDAVAPIVLVFVTPNPAALLLAIRFARFVSVILATFVAVAVTSVELVAVMLVKVVPDIVPVFPNSTAVNAAIIPFVLAA